MNVQDLRETAPMILAREGERLSGTPYRLAEKLGGGGMGQVFRAIHIELGREVAIKLLAPQLAQDEAAMKRLKREARAAARVGNPHIIDTYDLGVSEDGRPYVVMRLIQGCDLSTLMGEALEPKRVLNFLEQIADALQAAHGQGIVHRDLKPENVMVEERRSGEHLTVLDFGIAQSLQDTESRLTIDGQIIGTPGYMAPEQALAQPLDGRTDLYALAVIAYELFSGARPYPRLNALQLITSQITQPPEAFEEQPGSQRLPVNLGREIAKGMSRRPEERHPDVQSFIQALKASFEEMPTKEDKPLRSSAPLRLFSVAVLLALALGLGGSLGGFFKSSAPTRDLGVSVNPNRLEQSQAQGSQELLLRSKAQPSVDVGTKTQLLVDLGFKTDTIFRPDAVLKPDFLPSPKPKLLKSASLKSKIRRSKKHRSSKPKLPKPKPPEPKPPEPKPLEPEPPKQIPAAPPLKVEASKPIPPQPQAVRIVLSEPQLEGALSKRELRRALRGFPERLNSCIKGVGLVGSNAQFHFVIDEEGFFGELSTIGDPALARCGRKALRGKRLRRRPDTGNIKVGLRLRLEPR